MWHEARRQEKKVREVMVNLQRRAERRKEHYERLVSLLGIYYRDFAPSMEFVV